MPQAKRFINRCSARSSLIFSAFFLLSVLAGCSKPKTSQPETTNTPGMIDACALLTSQEIEAIQGAPLKDTKSSANSQGGLTVSQCYFLLSIAADSIVLTVTQKADGSNSHDPKQAWERIFGGDNEAENAREEKESKSPPPEKIAGLGDEAFWAPRRFGGTIYALKGNVYITISVGGSGEQTAKLQKSKALAEIVLKRL